MYLHFIYFFNVLFSLCLHCFTLLHHIAQLLHNTHRCDSWSPCKITYSALPDWVPVLNPSVVWRDMMEGENCPIWMKKVLIHMYALKCDACHNLVNRNCTLFTINEYDDLIKIGNLDWTFRICIESIFPFNHITDNHVFQNSLVEYFSDCHPFNIDST